MVNWYYDPGLCEEFFMSTLDNFMEDNSSKKLKKNERFSKNNNENFLFKKRVGLWFGSHRLFSSILYPLAFMFILYYTYIQTFYIYYGLYEYVVIFDLYVSGNYFLILYIFIILQLKNYWFYFFTKFSVKPKNLFRNYIIDAAMVDRADWTYHYYLYEIHHWYKGSELRHTSVAKTAQNNGITGSKRAFKLEYTQNIFNLAEFTSFYKKNYTLQMLPLTFHFLKKNYIFIEEYNTWFYSNAVRRRHSAVRYADLSFLHLSEYARISSTWITWNSPKYDTYLNHWTTRASLGFFESITSFLDTKRFSYIWYTIVNCFADEMVWRLDEEDFLKEIKKQQTILAKKHNNKNYTVYIDELDMTAYFRKRLKIVFKEFIKGQVEAPNRVENLLLYEARLPKKKKKNRLKKKFFQWF